MIHYFFNWLILEARTEIQKKNHLFFGSNENFEICFWDLLTFSTERVAEFVSMKCDFGVKMHTIFQFIFELNSSFGVHSVIKQLSFRFKVVVRHLLGSHQYCFYVDAEIDPLLVHFFILCYFSDIFWKYGRTDEHGHWTL